MLFKGLPESLEVDGIDYPIYTDFRIMLANNELMQDDSIPLNMRFLYGVENLYTERPDNILEAIKQMQWYERIGDTLSSNNDEQANSKPVFSFTHDYPYLYAAFKAQYNIDLFDDELHWWKFMFLFNSLDENHKLSKIIGYRSVDLKSIRDRDRRKFIIEQKRLYALPGALYSPSIMSNNDIANAFL